MNITNTIRNYIDTLNKYILAYDEGHPLVSDEEYDNLYFKLQQLENETGYVYDDSPTQTITYTIVNELNKVKHNHWMGSLDKTKDWDIFLNYFRSKNISKDVIGMPKLDGLTCSLRYIDGYLVSAETRGDGEIGEDILYNAQVIKSIPNRINYKDELVLDGEIICTYQDFEPHKDEYKNPRNFAAGSIRLLDSKECANRNLTFVVWNIIKGFNGNSFVDKLQEAKELGFIIVPYISSFDWDAKEYLQDTAKELGYPIDGLVGRFDDIEYGESLGSTAHHSNAAYAFKFYDEIYETRLIDIDYDVSRKGVLTPVALFEPIDIEGTEVSRSSLCNLSIMEEKLGNPYKGQLLKISKRNQIIPYVESAVKADLSALLDYILPLDKCPICGGQVAIETSDTGVQNLYCSNDECPRKLNQRINHYCDRKHGLDVKGLSLATIEKLIDLDWLNNIIDLYSLKEHRLEWIKLPGFGEKSVDKILNAIEESKHCKLESFIAALGIPLIGIQVAKVIAEHYPTWEEFKNAVGGNWSALPGFGYEMEKALNNFDYSEADKIAEMLDFEHQEAKTAGEHSDTSALNICVTGKLGIIWAKRDDLVAFVESKGSKVTSTVTSKTDYLVCNQDSNSAKHKKARELNVPIINETQLKLLLS
jgi:DNA ligase (NAD+)